MRRSIASAVDYRSQNVSPPLGAPLFRLTVEPSAANGLQHGTQIIIDKIVTIPRETISSRLGAWDHKLMVRVDRSLAVFPRQLLRVRPQDLIKRVVRLESQQPQFRF